MSARFSLRRLSQKELSTVLLCMTSIDRLSYSLCSQKCKKEIVALNLIPYSLSLTFSREFRFEIDFLRDSQLKIATPERDLEAPGNFTIHHFPDISEEEEEAFFNQVLQLGPPPEEFILAQEEDHEVPEIIRRIHRDVELDDIMPNSSSWNYEGISVAKWLRHTMEIYHKKSVDLVRFYDARHFDLGEIENLLGKFGVKRMQIEIAMPRFVGRILNLDIPVKGVSILLDAFRNAESFRKISIRNFNYIYVNGKFHSGRNPYTLDELLLTNASHITLNSPILSGKDFNRFLKFWIRGSHKRLKLMNVVMSDVPDFIESVVLKRIHYTRISNEDWVQKIWMNGFRDEVEEQLFEHVIDGGYNIRCRDGREATIGFGIVDNRVTVQFFVYN